MKTLKEFKNTIQEGTRIVCKGREEARIDQNYTGDMNNAPYGPLNVVPLNEKMQGTRTVTYKDTTGFYLNATPEDNKRGSFLGWPKASELETDGNVFTITCNSDRGPWLRLLQY